LFLRATKSKPNAAAIDALLGAKIARDRNYDLAKFRQHLNGA
jgi:hypothetical protein